jgi:cytochrome c553
MATGLPLALIALGAAVFSLQVRASAPQDYMLYCMGCHGADAHGVPGKVPALAGALSRFMRTPQGRDYVLRVPGAANSVLADAQLAAVLNWLAARDAAAGELRVAPFTEAEVALVRHTPLSNVLATRHEVVAALAATGPAPAQEY